MKIQPEDLAFYRSCTLLHRDGAALHATRGGEEVIFDLTKTNEYELLRLGAHCAPKCAEYLVDCLTPVRLRLLVERQCENPAILQLAL